MRGTIILLLSCLVGCAATETTSEEAEAEPFTPPEIDYDAARSDYVAEPEEDEWLRADVTLVDLDGDAVARMFDLDDASDIAPRSFRWPAGEVAAAGGINLEGSELLARPSFWVDEGEAHDLRHSRRHFYFAELVGEDAASWTPIIDEYLDVVNGTIEVKELGDDRFNVKAKVDTQMAGGPVQVRSLGPTDKIVHRPNLVRAQRLGVESLSPGETAMFQLARINTGERVVYRLLFVCLVDTRKE